MFCPNCGGEFRDEIEICPDCDRKLIPELPTAWSLRKRSPESEPDALEKAIKQGARWFYWVAGLSLVNLVLILVRADLRFLIGLGITDGLNLWVQEATTGVLKANLQALGLVVALLAVSSLAAFGWLAQRRKSWAFVVGGLLYVGDAVVCLGAQDLPSAGFHSLALFFMFRGFWALRRLQPADVVGKAIASDDSRTDLVADSKHPGESDASQGLTPPRAAVVAVGSLAVLAAVGVLLVGMVLGVSMAWNSGFALADREEAILSGAPADLSTSERERLQRAIQAVSTGPRKDEVLFLPVTRVGILLVTLEKGDNTSREQYLELMHALEAIAAGASVDQESWLSEEAAQDPCEIKAQLFGKDSSQYRQCLAESEGQ